MRTNHLVPNNTDFSSLLLILC